MFTPSDLLDLSQCPCPELFEGIDFAWQAVARLADFIADHARSDMRGTLTGSPYIGPKVVVGEGTTIEHGAVLHGPAIIGRDCQVRAGAYIRGHLIAGDGCILGNSCEFKNAILFNDVHVPHLSYVGDSILGHRVHFGAGVICSNRKASGGTVRIKIPGGEIDTRLAKLGAVVGDHGDIGCNCVLNPGSIIGRRSILYPGVVWRGVLDANRIVKLRQQHESTQRRS